MKHLFAIFLGAAFALIGCAGKKQVDMTPAPQVAHQPIKKFSFINLLTSPLKWIPKKKSTPQAETPLWIGIVKMVDVENQFVLVDTKTMTSVMPGDLLICIAKQQETASLRVSNLKSQPFLIADIARGKPSVGDRIYKPSLADR